MVSKLNKIEKENEIERIRISSLYSYVLRKLIAYPRGSQNDDNLSLFVEVAEENDLEPDWSFITNFTFTVVSQSFPDKKVQREGML